MTGRSSSKVLGTVAVELGRCKGWVLGPKEREGSLLPGERHTTAVSAIGGPDVYTYKILFYIYIHV